MDVVKAIGSSTHTARYEVPDDQLAVGSTLGGPKLMTVIDDNGAIQKVWSVDMGVTLFGTLRLRHYDAGTGMLLRQDQPGSFFIHAEHQEHRFWLPNGVGVLEAIFALSDQRPGNGSPVPPAAYYTVELSNPSDEAVDVLTYAYCVLRGETTPDITAEYDAGAGALIAWNLSKPDQVRILGASEEAESYETTLDYGEAVARQAPGTLSCTTSASSDPLGVLQHRHHLEPGGTCRFWYVLTFGQGKDEALANFHAAPPADDALSRTRAYYQHVLHQSVVLTPDPSVNRGVLWAKANTLRVETKAPTGWAFTNDPTRSNNSVGRDTAWFAYGAGYLTPDFVRDSLLAYVDRQEDNGMIVEYYDIRTGHSEDYGLNINDDTPLLIIALWHYYSVTGDEDFLQRIYPAAVKAARYILSQRNEQGLVWCTATGTNVWGICSWRNVIPNYRLSGAVTEVNAECYSALLTVSHMARELGKHDESAEFREKAQALRTAINGHLLDPQTGLYYLHIDLAGQPRSDVTSDLLFPLIFSVAEDDVATRIIARLSDEDFWTSAGMHTTPRDSPTYTPSGGWGLLGGVWVAVSFWYAFAAARYAPSFMAYALGTSFRNYSIDPRGTNTVPGQFSEWLNGATLVNEGMMLSPWFPPRYLWAAIEGMAGLSVRQGQARIEPHLAPEWKWLGVQNLPYKRTCLTWLAVRAPDLRLYTNFLLAEESMSYVAYEEDVTDELRAPGNSIATIGLRQRENLLLFAGNTADQTVNTSLRFTGPLSGQYRLRDYDSLIGNWVDQAGLIPAEDLSRGLPIEIERKGFRLLDLRQEV